MNVIWAGSDDGLVHVTRNGGTTWTNVTPKDMPEFGRVSQIDASSFDDGSAYVAVKRPLLNDVAPYIFRTHDFGKTWTKIVNGIRPNDYVHAVREDPTRRGLLYAGTQHGVYISYDDGDTLAVALAQPAGHPDRGPDRRGELDRDRDARAQLLRARQHRAAPAVHAGDRVGERAVSVRAGAGAAARQHRRDPVLAQAGAAQPDDRHPRCGGEGRAHVQGRRRRTRARASRAAADDDDDDGRATGSRRRRRWWRASTRRCGTCGTPPATTFPGMILWGATTNGPLAVPGTYQVRLTVDGKTLTRPVTVRKNPLLTDVTLADLREQFDLAIQIRDKVSEANQAVIKIRDLKKQTTDRLTKSQDRALKTVADSFSKHVSDVEEAIYQVRNQSGQDPLNFPIKVNNRLGDAAAHGDDGRRQADRRGASDLQRPVRGAEGRDGSTREGVGGRSREAQCGAEAIGIAEVTWQTDDIVRRIGESEPRPSGCFLSETSIPGFYYSHSTIPDSRQSCHAHTDPPPATPYAARRAIRRRAGPTPMSRSHR